MFIIDTPISLLVGAAVAYSASGNGSTIENRNRAFSRGLLIQSLLITPLTVFFLLRFPDWEVSYLVDARTTMESTLGPWLGMLFIIWLTAFYVVGFKWGEKLIASGKRNTLKKVVFGLLGIITVINVYVFRETLYLGTTAQYHAGTAPGAVISYEFLAAVFIGLPSWIIAYMWAIKPAKATA
jgi:hypothetical protein